MMYGSGHGRSVEFCSVLACDNLSLLSFDWRNRHSCRARCAVNAGGLRITRSVGAEYRTEQNSNSFNKPNRTNVVEINRSIIVGSSWTDVAMKYSENVKVKWN